MQSAPGRSQNVGGTMHVRVTGPARLPGVSASDPVETEAGQGMVTP